MAKTKKPVKAKEPVRLRFKELANGNQSIYLDIYHDGRRSYEFLKLYLVPEKGANASIAKSQNEETMKSANAIKSHRIIELANSDAGIKKSNSRSKMLLVDWLEYCCKQKQKTESSLAASRNIHSLIVHIVRYNAGKVVMMKDVDRDYCKGFIDYLKTARVKKDQQMAKSSAALYFRIFVSILNIAVKADVIDSNPTSKISKDEKIKTPDSTREYLSVDEVKRLMETPCIYESIKQSYLFCCFCGLRISDVRTLRWGDIDTEDGQARLKIVMHKTKNQLYLPLSEQALKWLPERGDAQDSDNIFSLPPKNTMMRNLRIWAQNAGITKNVTFHTSRHTFATMNITAGVDLYTTSKLLGHTNIAITQIYAKIIDKKKDEAVNLVSNLFN